MSSGMMVSNRNYTHRSTTGHTIKFEAGKPEYVPPECRREVLAVGIIPDKGEVEATEIESAEDVVSRPINVAGGLREAVIFDVMSKLVANNVTTEFDAAGRPKEIVVNKRAGFVVRPLERNRIWEEFMTLRASKEDLPTHKHTKLYFKLLDVTSSEEIKQYGEALGVSQDILDTFSIAEGKKLLLQKLVTE